MIRETDATKAFEARVAQHIAKQMRLHDERNPAFYPLDRSLIDSNGIIRTLLEVKQRKAFYTAQWITGHKASAAALYAAMHLPTIFAFAVPMPDGGIDVRGFEWKLTSRLYPWGFDGRADRGTVEKEPVMLVPLADCTLTWKVPAP